MYKFKIDSLNCMSCVHNIQEALGEYDKSLEAKADVRNKTLSVETSLPLEKIKELIENAGYPVSEVVSQ
ncbi:MAG TPA: heavy metal-associated domain-containing protein [Bacteriovoracaceae bacterium]|nr:heavy metal-associated domain-containing protein [Bacteriovoracaceae bacterium]